MGKYVSKENVRNAGGFPTELITDDNIENALEIVEEYASRKLNTFFSPRLITERHKGDNKRFFFTWRNPILRVEKVETDDIELGLEKLDVERESGKINLTLNSEQGIFRERKDYNIFVRYYTAFLKADSDFNVSSEDVGKGENVYIPVENEPKVEVGDWVEIRTMRNYTSAKVLEVNTDSIKVDKLNIDLDKNSIITKLILPKYINRLIELEATLYLAINAIGATYVFNAGYSLGDLNIQKGVPYTHWRESTEKVIKERDNLVNIIKPRFKIV